MEKIADKLIILQGNSNSGKTTTLINVIHSLIDEKGFTAGDQPILEGDQRVLLKDEKGFSVAICSAGDSLEIIEQNYRFFLEHNCDVMISACSINVDTHLDGSRTNLAKTSLIGFASGYWKSAEVHFNADSKHVKIFTLYAIKDVPVMGDAIIKEIQMAK